MQYILFRNGREEQHRKKDIRYRIRSLDTDIEVHEALRDEAENQAATEIALISQLRREKEQLVNDLMENAITREKEAEEKEDENGGQTQE